MGIIHSGKRVLLVVAYDGTDYGGWQIQPNAVTIEEVLNRELSALLHEDIHVIGASRTDAGVHAEGAVCVFDTASRIPGEKFSYALNQRKALPDDIRIMASREVPADFHPRKTKSIKTYRYSIWNATFQPPTERLYTCHVYVPLNVDAMRKAAAYLVGEHDFRSFCKEAAAREAYTHGGSTVRRIESIVIKQDGSRIDIYVRGNGFLYNMVRIITGTLLEIGKGQYGPEEMPRILQKRDRAFAGETAPAQGLCLMGYEWLELDDREMGQ